MMTECQTAEQTDFRREDYLKLVNENQGLRQQLEFYERQARAFQKEMLRERLWRISFQIEHLKTLSECTKSELDQMEEPMEKHNGE